MMCPIITIGKELYIVTPEHFESLPAKYFEVTNKRNRRKIRVFYPLVSSPDMEMGRYYHKLTQEEKKLLDYQDVEDLSVILYF